MAVIDVVPLVLKDVELIIGGTAETPATDDYRKHADNVTFTPSAAQNTWTGMGLNTYTDTSVATWTVAIEYVQDWDTEGSLARYLYENEGATVPMTFRPRAGAGPSFTANVTITPGAIGGAVNAYAVTTVTLGSDKPELVPAGA